MKQQIAQQWAAALRGGEYQQGIGSLRQHNSFCVLGVLCDLHLKSYPENTGWVDNGSVSSYQDFQLLLPNSVIEWAGMRTSNGQYGGMYGFASLSGSNDTGSSFNDIADIIDANWQNL